MHLCCDSGVATLPAHSFSASPVSYSDRGRIFEQPERCKHLSKLRNFAKESRFSSHMQYSFSASTCRKCIREHLSVALFVFAYIAS